MELRGPARGVHSRWTLYFVGLFPLIMRLTISAVFRRGGDVSFVAEELKAVFDPRGGSWMKGKYVPSILAAIGNILEQHMVAIGFLGSGAPAVAAADGVVRSEKPKGQACPSCGEFTVIREDGCEKCTTCLWSRCG